MKQVLFWKYVDATGQILMLLPVIMIVSPENRNMAMLTYFSVGIWQIISCFLNGIYLTPQSGSRINYRKILTRILIMGGITLIGANLFRHLQWLMPLSMLFSWIVMIEGLILLFIAPFLAFWYLSITFDELNILRKALEHRKEIHWKL